MRLTQLTVPAAFCLLMLGCSSGPKAPMGADGQKIAIEVSVDGGYEQVDAANANQVNQRNQLVNYMRKTTVEQLNTSGYDASLLDTAKGPTAGKRSLALKIDNYNPGSAAARVLVGLGAGAATLDVTAIYKEGANVLLTTQKSVASGRDWRKVVKKINILIMREMAPPAEAAKAG